MVSTVQTTVITRGANVQHIVFGCDQGAIASLDGGASWRSWYNQSTEQVYHYGRLRNDVDGNQQCLPVNEPSGSFSRVLCADANKHASVQTRRIRAYPTERLRQQQRIAC